MAEHIELHEDVDPDLTWYDWGHFLEHDHRCIPGILAGLPAATNPQDDTLRYEPMENRLGVTGCSAALSATISQGQVMNSGAGRPVAFASASASISAGWSLPRLPKI